MSNNWIAGVAGLPPEGVYPAGVGQIRAARSGRSALRAAVRTVLRTSDNTRYDDRTSFGAVRDRIGEVLASPVQMQSDCRYNRFAIAFLCA